MNHATTRLSQGCERFIEAGWLAAVIVTPLFVNMYSRRGFDADKTALLRALVVLMAAAWLIKWLDQLPFKRPRALSGVAALVLSLIAAYALITLTSIAPNISLLGSYTRLQGTYTLIAYAVLFGIMAHELRTRAQLDRLLNTLILTSVPVAGYGLIQAAGLDPLWAPGQFAERVTSTLGNPIYLGAYLLMVFFVTIGKVIESWQTRRPGRGLAVGVYTILAAVQLLAFALAGSRGPFVGWLAGCFFFLLVAGLLYRKRRLVMGVVGTGLAAGLVLMVINLPDSPLASIRAVPGLGRFFNLTTAPGDSGYARTLIWAGSASLVQPHAPIQFPNGPADSLNAVRPLIGYGPEAMYLVFQQYFPPALAAETGYGGDTFVNRSHNETWDALVTGGLIGLAVYQGAMLFILVTGLRGLDLLATPADCNWLIGLWLALGALGGAAACWLGGVPYFGLGWPIGTLLGLTLYLVRCARRGTSTPPAPRPAPDRILLAALLIGLIAHYVEIQFGIAVVASRLMFWVLAALSVVLNRPEPLEVEPPSGSVIGRAAGYGVTSALIGVTLLFAFITNYEQLTNPVIMVWRSLTYNSLQKTDSAAILGLMMAAWGAAILIMQVELTQANLIRRWRDRVSATLLWLSLALGLTAGFGLLFAAQPGLQPQTAQLSNLIQYARARLDLFDLFVGSAIGLIGLLAIGLLADRRSVLTPGVRRAKAWDTLRARLRVGWAAIALFPIGLAAAWWSSVSNLDVIRADIVYKQGQSMASFANWDYAIGLYQQAIAYTPHEDTYYRGLGQAFIDKAASLDGTAPTRFDANPPASAVLTMNWQDLARLNRADSLYAAIAVFNLARQINPLNADHTAGLALAYQRLADNATDSRQREQFATAAQQLYAVALRLRPQDANLQTSRVLGNP